MTKAEVVANRYCFKSGSPFPNTEKAAVIYGYEQAEKDVKDVLLEWLNEKMWEFPEDEFENGINAAIEQMIDKLNSL